MRFEHLAVLAGVVAAAACSDTTPLSPDPEASRNGQGAQNVAVMTRNLYIGFDADAAVAALATGDPTVFGPVLQASVVTLQKTDFTVRARAFAEEIARNRPHAVGLQEVYRIHADLSPLGMPVTIDLDYLAMLQAALAERNLPYAVVATIVNTDMQPLPGIQLLDREAMLVDTSRVQVLPGVIATRFQTNIGPLMPGVDKKAGYIAAPVIIGGMPVLFVTTHFESDLGPASHPMVTQIRAAQAAEIAAVIGTTAQVVVVGDLNDEAGSLMYQVFTGAGFTDAWPALRLGLDGSTGNCFGPDLSDAAPHCNERIDFILARGFNHPRAGLLGTAARLGVNPTDQVTGPAGLLWPSDHAGLAANLLVPPANGLRN